MEYHADVEINAPAACVWEVLADFAAYPEWNSFLKIGGSPVVGSRVKASYQTDGIGRMVTNMRATVLGCETDRHLRWAGFMWVPSWFEVDHSFRVQTIGTNRSYFIQRIAFTGSLIPFVIPFLESSLRRGLKEMSQALKERAESETGVKIRVPQR
jgi:hypothetical protein